MDVRAILEFWGGWGRKNNHCSEMGPNTNLYLYFKKNLAHYWHN